MIPFIKDMGNYKGSSDSINFERMHWKPVYKFSSVQMHVNKATMTFHINIAPIAFTEIIPFKVVFNAMTEHATTLELRGFVKGDYSKMAIHEALVQAAVIPYPAEILI